MDAEQLHQLAIRQLADYDTRTPNRLFAHPLDLTNDQAYQLQNEVTRLREQRGETVIGYKVGCTSRTIQQQLGIDEPIFGRLFDSGFHQAGVLLSATRYARLAIEGELAVRLSRDLSSATLAEEAYEEAIADVFPVIELHHFERCSPHPCCAELIASNGMHAGVVLAREPTAARGWRPADSLAIRIDGSVVEAVENPTAIVNPVDSLRWLSGRLAGLGLRLAEGQIVLTGSPMKLHSVAAGQKIVVEAPPLGKSWAEVGP